MAEAGTPAPRFNADGLVPAVAQHAHTGAVLMVAYMNEDAWRLTLANRRATFFSRSRGRLWEKGETSGNTLHVQTVTLDCDRDTVLLSVLPDGPTCHTGAESCFTETVATGD